MTIARPACASIATTVCLASVAVATVPALDAPAHAGALQDQVAHAMEKLFKRQGAKLLSGYGSKLVVVTLAEHLGVPRDVAGNLFNLVKVVSVGESVDLAALSPIERVAIQRSGATYARTCPPDEDVSTALRFVPIPDPPAPDAEIACAALHDMGLIALKLAR